MSEREEKIAEIFRAWDSRETPGCAVGVVEDGRLAFARGFGMADLERGVPISASSVFHAASLSKQFTAFLVALLAAEGKLALDDDVRTYLPELPDYGHRLTLLHLIHHTSGIRDQWSLLSLAGWREHDVVTNADVLALAARQRGLDFRPGDEYQYSNTGYTLLGLIIERVTGQSLRAFADTRLFLPLGLTRTHFRDDHTELVPDRALAYFPRAGGGYGVSIPAFDTVGATSLFTTVEDLARWLGNLFEPRIGGSEVLARVLTPGRLNDGSAIHYAFGLDLGDYGGLATISHAGGDAGYRAFLLCFREQRLGVAVLGNVSAMSPDVLAYQVADLYLGGRAAPAPAPPAARAEPPVGLEKLAGNYWDRAAGKLRRVELGEGGLRVPVWPGYAYELVPQGGGVFAVPDAPITFRFTDGGPEAIALTETLNGRVVRRYQRVAAVDHADLNLGDYVGMYRCDDVGAEWTVQRRDQRMLVLQPKRAEEALDPLFVDGFLLGGWDPVVFHRDARGEVDGFSLSTFRVRNLPFRRMGES